MFVNLINSNEKCIIDDDFYPIIEAIGNISLDQNGYVRFGNHTKYPLRLHRYVAKFYYNDIDNLDVHHINGNKKDNRITNLKCMTKGEHSKIESKAGNHNWKELDIHLVKKCKYELKYSLKLTAKMCNISYNNFSRSLKIRIGKTWSDL